MIVAKTKLRKLPAGCRKCPYYRPEQYSVYGSDPGMCMLLWHGTENVVVSRQRLPECPLMDTKLEEKEDSNERTDI